jgi:hypothetical protein
MDIIINAFYGRWGMSGEVETNEAFRKNDVESLKKLRDILKDDTNKVSSLEWDLKRYAAMLIHFTTDAPLWEFYCDSDWAGCPTTRRSTKGYVIKFMGGPLVAVSRRQRNVTKSSCEAEYCTLSDCAADIIWIKNLAEIFKCTFPSPAILRCDNQTAINMANSEVALKRTKHIEAFKKFIGVKYHWIRELVRYSCKKQAAVVLYCILGPS